MGIRKQLSKKIKHHIKDLEKRGIDVSRVTGGKSIEKLAWNKRTYENFMKQKKKVLIRERDIKKRTNANGYLLSEKEYKTVKSLEKAFNNKKDNELKKFINKFGKLSDVEVAFLKGKPVRHLNSNENIELQTSFRKENLFDSFSPNIDLKFFKEFVEEEIDDFSYQDVIDKRREEFINQLDEWTKDGRLGIGGNYPQQVKEELLKEYDNMGFIQSVQFNQDLKHKMQYVESASKNIYSTYDEKALLKDLLKRQDDRKFIISE